MMAGSCAASKYRTALLIVSKPKPECSVSNRTKSQPGALQDMADAGSCELDDEMAEL